MDDTLFHDLIDRARQGDDEAVVTLLERYENEIRMMVRHRLPHSLRSKFDSLDFVQAIWASLLVNPDREPVDFADSRHFRGFLAAVVRNKVNQEYRKRSQPKYAVSREEALYIERGGRREAREIAGSDPTASQEVQATDRMARLTAGLSSAEAEALALRREGLTFEEIATRVGLHERTVRQLVKDLREREEAREWR